MASVTSAQVAHVERGERVARAAGAFMVGARPRARRARVRSPGWDVAKRGRAGQRRLFPPTSAPGLDRPRRQSQSPARRVPPRSWDSPPPPPPPQPSRSTRWEHLGPATGSGENLTWPRVGLRAGRQRREGGTLRQETWVLILYHVRPSPVSSPCDLEDSPHEDERRSCALCVLHTQRGEFPAGCRFKMWTHSERRLSHQDSSASPSHLEPPG